MAKDPNVTVEYVRALFTYDPNTGKFARKIKYGSQQVGDEPGCLSPQSYWYIGVGGRPVPAHRLAWFYVHGEWPPNDVDHINGLRADNRLTNLRCVTRAENLRRAARPSRYAHLNRQYKRARSKKA